MKRLVVIVEGETEEGFVNDILCPYLQSKGIYNNIQCFKIKHSGGGISKYSHIREDILRVVHESAVLVTTMVDFYRLPSSFPGMKELSTKQTHCEQVAYLEQKMQKDIAAPASNFIPYIQLHEFEALLFSSPAGIEALFERSEMDVAGLQRVFDLFANPEDINNGPDTAPSMRLKALIKGYDKVLYGKSVLQEIGMETVLAKCPKFKQWVEQLEVALR